MIYRVAIIEDEKEPAENLRRFVEKYGTEKGHSFNIQIFANGVDFITDYTANYDIVFMDIELPMMNGMECARKLRELDTSVALVFVTNMVQYSVKGYEVDAVGYIVKPIEFFSFSLLMDKIIDKIKLTNLDYVVVRNNDSMVRIMLTDLMYVEVMDHYLIYHVSSGKTYKQLGKIKDTEEQLVPYDFFRCNNSFLVNMRYVTSIDGANVCLGEGYQLPVSRKRKRDFLTALNTYFRKGGIC
ncbi:MAG: LytTR family DNA-binding domain-containing protein [Clostridia bacterium]|nr:LytTR family DNA-binding domain-containing protein [Clostridia bacterium]